MSGFATKNDELFIYTEQLINAYWEFEKQVYALEEDYSTYAKKMNKLLDAIYDVINDKIFHLFYDKEIDGELCTICNLIVKYVWELLDVEDWVDIDKFSSYLDVLDDALWDAADKVIEYDGLDEDMFYYPLEGLT